MQTLMIMTILLAIILMLASSCSHIDELNPNPATTVIKTIIKQNND